MKFFVVFAVLIAGAYAHIAALAPLAIPAAKLGTDFGCDALEAALPQLQEAVKHLGGLSSKLSRTGGKLSADVCEKVRCGLGGIINVFGNIGADGLSKLGIPSDALKGALGAFNGLGDLAGNMGGKAGSSFGGLANSLTGGLSGGSNGGSSGGSSGNGDSDASESDNSGSGVSIDAGSNGDSSASGNADGGSGGSLSVGSDGNSNSDASSQSNGDSSGFNFSYNSESGSDSN